MNYPQNKSIEFVAPPRVSTVTLAIETRGPAEVAYSDFKLVEVREQLEPGSIRLNLPFAYRNGIFATTPDREISGTIEVNPPRGGRLDADGRREIRSAR